MVVGETGPCATGLDPWFDRVRPTAEGFEVMTGFHSAFARHGADRSDVPRCITYLDVAHADRIDIGAPIQVRGGTGTARLRGRLCDSYSEVFASAGIRPTEWSVLDVPTRSLLPGVHYEVVCDSRPPLAAFCFIGLERHGAPQSVPEFAMDGGQIDGICAAGVSMFGVRVSVCSGAKVREPADVTVDLWMATRAADGSDPVVEHDGVHVLREPLAVVHTSAAHLEPVALPLPLHATLPIPDDRGLVGNVLLWQWAVTSADGRIAVSDVFGCVVLVPILAKDFDTALARVRTTFPRVPEASVAALRGWIAQRPEWALAGAARERHARALKAAK